MAKSILVIHGPNLQLLGKRETSIYGIQTLDDINNSLKVLAAERNVSLEILQSNHEGEIVTFIGEHLGTVDGVIINPAAYTHTSVAIRDALSALAVPVVEVHLSNIYQREAFRHQSFISPIATGVITGFGANSYILALHAIFDILGSS